MRLEIGDIVKTSYGTGPYVIEGIRRDCTCPKPLDEINMDDPPASPPHIGLILKGHYYLNGYDEFHLDSINLLIKRIEEYQRDQGTNVPDTNTPCEIDRCIRGKV